MQYTASAYNEFVLRNHPNKDKIILLHEMAKKIFNVPRYLNSEDEINVLSEKLNSVWQEQRRLFAEGITPEVKLDLDYMDVLRHANLNQN